MITRARLWWTFFWLGCTGFGGGVAVLAQIYTLVVVKRRWLTESEYWEAAAFGQSLPGSAAANAIGFIGLRLQGSLGALLAVSAFILPSFILMLGLTVIYRKYNQIPNMAAIFFGMNAAVVGIVLAVSIKMSQRILKARRHYFISLFALLALLTELATVVEVILLSGLLEILFTSIQTEKTRSQTPANLSVSNPPINQRSSTPESKSASADAGKKLSLFVPLPILSFYIATLPLLAQLAILFLRIGAVTFGGGFVMIPLIEQEVVNNAHWLNHKEFVDGMALGQITPGPVIITATFIGYYVYGFTGATIATVAVFLPPFLMTVIAGHSLEHMRTNPQVNAFLQGVTPAVVGLMFAAVVKLAQTSLNNYLSTTLMLASCLILLRWRVTPVLVMLGAAIIGLMVLKLMGS
jgi:chromate transporter